VSDTRVTGPSGCVWEGEGAEPGMDPNFVVDGRADRAKAVQLHAGWVTGSAGVV
jgi:hypothetical protein